MSKNRVVAAVLFSLVIALILFLCLFGNSSALLSWDGLDWVLQEMGAIFRDSGMQWMGFLCVAIYCAAFLFLQHRRNEQRFFRSNNSLFWLAVFLVLVAGGYFIGYATASRSTPALTLEVSIAFGLGFQVCSTWHPPKSRWRYLTLIILICFLLIAAFWQPEILREYEYRGRSRLTGPWDNPNTFGLLMGTGLVLAVGMAFVAALYERRLFRVCAVGGHRPPLQKYLCVSFCLIAAILIGRALFQSLSRGAWLATCGGLGYLMFQAARRKRKAETVSTKSKIGNQKCHKAHLTPALSPQPPGGVEESLSCGLCVSWLRKNGFPSIVVLASLAVLTVWHFRQTEWHPARRALSAGNLNDFSWRNRVAAWEGTLQMMAEKPWFGFGWNQPEPMYEHYYLQPRLTESAAIQMNDYLLLGATLGIPTLFCFGMYVALSLREVPSSKFQVPSGTSQLSTIHYLLSSSDWLQTTCRAGAIVLLVGFWFDGGLFKLATASTFWILLELGRVEPRMDTNQHEWEPRPCEGGTDNLPVVSGYQPDNSAANTRIKQ